MSGYILLITVLAKVLNTCKKIPDDILTTYNLNQIEGGGGLRGRVGAKCLPLPVNSPPLLPVGPTIITVIV